MKKLYLLLTLMLFAIQYITGQTTETFESSTINVPTFTTAGKTFNLTSPFGFTVVSFPVDLYGYNQTPNFIQVSDPNIAGAYGQTGVITAASGSFKMNSFWFYVSGDAQSNPGATNGGGAGSVTFRGKLAGVTLFTVVRNTTGGNTGFALPGNGFTLVNFTTEGGSDNSNTIIDQLEIQISSNYDYFAIDNFQFTNGAVPPTVTTTIAANVGAVKATLGGNVTADGGDSTIERGIVWATTTNPTTANNKIQIGTGTGIFSNNVGNFPASTLIYYKAYAKNSGGTSYGGQETFTTGPALATSSTSQTNVSCNGGGNGTATVVASGGKTPYTYSWSPSGGTNATATGLSQGSYTVTITDGESTQITRNFTLTQPAAAINLSTGGQTNISCFGGGNGTATVIPSGGTPGYTYSWAPSGGTSATASGLSIGTYTVTVTDANSCQATRSFTITQPASALNASTGSQTNISCRGGANGTATVVPSGGTPSYTYSWSPSGGTAATASGLAVGTYTVTVTDANACQATKSFTITEPATVLTASAGSQGNVSCNGGSNGYATVVGSGGTVGYSYSWAPSGGTAATASGLAAGTYIATVTDANGCTATQSFTITQPTTALAVAPVSQTNIACKGGATGAASITASGGTGGYTYSWAPSGGTSASATGLTAGNYTVTVTDANSCTATQSFTITEPTFALNATAAAQTNISCYSGSNGTATVSVTGGTPGYTYSWAPSGGTNSTATGLSAGTYTVTVTDANACQDTQSFTITEPAAALTASAAGQTNVSCNSGANGSATVSVTGGTAGYTYSWSPSGGTAATASGLTAGTYTVTVTDANACQATQSFTITEPSVLVVTPVAQTNIACNGAATGSASIIATGGTGTYTYSWSPSGGTAANATGLTVGTYTVTVTDANSCTATQSFTITEPTALVASPLSQTDVSCNGGANGTATVSVTGGTPGYTYSWAPSGGTAATAFGLSAGTYIATVTDANGCTATQSFTIAEPTTLVASVGSQTNVSCNSGANGSAAVSVTGGIPGYTYSWAPSGGTAATASGLTAGTYTVTVTDANNCQATQSFTITEPAVLSPSVDSQTNVSCNGGSNGSATVSATGGTGTYTYVWAPYGGTAATATGLAAGTFTVTITDANLCSATQSFTITEPSVLVATPVAQTNIACNGAATGSATIIATGGTGAYTYSWSPSGGTASTATGLTAGTYTVTVTDDNSCTATQSFTITEPTALVATAVAQSNVSCNSGANGTATIIATGGTPGYTYSWSPSGGTSTTASGLSAGTYTATVTDANGCTATQSFTISEPALLDTTGSQTNVSCNSGANGTATVTVTGGTPGYTYSWAPFGGNAATATGLSAGTYTVTVSDANSCMTTQSFTITEPTLLVASAGAQTNVSCNGGANGTATVNVTGGTTGYTYSWSPSGGTADTATGLTAGTYTVTVTDANACQTTQSFTITEPTLLVVVPVAQTNIACNGSATGSASISAVGGTGPYTYSWAPSGGTSATATGLSAGTYTATVTDANGCSATQSFTLTEPTALVATAVSQNNVSCNSGSNGTATVSATGGTPGYTYSWSPSGGTATTAIGLSAGTYTATVTDANGCTTTQNFTITEPDAIAATPSQTNVSCNGGSNGSASVSVTGGTGTYTYSWAPFGGTADTATGLIAGTYTVTITDANLCSATQSITITEPTILIASIGTQTNVSCNGGVNGSATVTATGGTGAYTYSWAPFGGTADTATGLAAGTYTVTVTDANNCTATQSFTITEPTLLVASASAQTDVTCNGSATGSATVAATGGTGSYTYSWSPSGGTADTASGLTAGTYTATVTDANGCSATQSFTITEPAALVATASSQTNISCNGAANGAATVTATGGTGSYTYSWSPSGGTADTATGLTAGTYTATVTDANGCTATQSFTITEPAILAVAVNVLTNVTCNAGSDAAATAIVSGGTGAYTYSWAPTGGTADTASGLSAGTYTVTVTDANGCIATQTFTINEPSPIVATALVQANVSCNGEANGSAIVNATGGTGAYTYSWSPSGGTAATATGLAAGTYTVTVTDANGCFATQSVTITQPLALFASASAQTNITCNGSATGSATVAATGGTGTYTYSWSPSGGTTATATGLAAGTYTATVTDANGCTATQAFSITQPTPLVITAVSQTNITCNGDNTGAATVNVTGGTGTYTYAWSPSGGTAATATGLSAGTYTVTATDANGCTATQNFTITEPTPLMATVTVTDVTCPGASNGSAIITTTGGSGSYTYAWSPTGGSNPTATGLVAGTYNVTITDTNGCALMLAVVITTTPDTTAPVPNVTNLPDINGYCSVSSAEIAIPTATDTCAGIINATTTSPLNYSVQGSYVITWTYNDGNGNTATQNQNVNVLASPLSAVTFSNANVTYDGTVHTIQVANLPVGANVAYTTTPASGTLNGAVNAGTYTITAIINPSTAAPNCSPVTLTATLTIAKAVQQITFDPIPVKVLGTNNTFNLDAFSSSGLPIRYTFTYTSPLPPATVSATGQVTMLRTGQGIVTAHQDGNNNYLPAADVSQILTIMNNNADLTKLTIGGVVYNNPPKQIIHLMLCGENSINITSVNNSNATISPSANFNLPLPRPGIYNQTITVTSQDGSVVNKYNITIIKPFSFYDIVRQKFNNVLLVNNNPQTNGGYDFVGYEWFKNGQSIGKGQYYSAGNSENNVLDNTADYMVKLTTRDGQVLQTCSDKVVLQNTLEAKLYPNPIESGKVVTVEADFPEDEIKDMQISLYSISGQLIKTLKSSTVKTEVQLPDSSTDGNMYLVVIETASFKKSLKVIVK
ncbi:MAG: T9SS type A sorting domain-containing protein [Sphingobacteriales bacterium]|nr:MAG: T9SS type A sorting domain-containing protein [Sphingobacteriales bacterium]